VCRAALETLGSNKTGQLEDKLWHFLSRGHLVMVTAGYVVVNRICIIPNINNMETR
jgi:hypothetical protein